MQTVFPYRQRKIVFRCGKNVSPYTFPRFGVPKHTFVLRIERQRRKSSGFFLGRSAHSGFLSISRCIASFSLSVLFRIQDETNETPVPDWVLAFVLCDTTAKCARAHPCNGRAIFGKLQSVLCQCLTAATVRVLRSEHCSLKHIRPMDARRLPTDASSSPRG